MELIETSVKAPSDGIVSPVIASGSVVLRSARWPPALDQAGFGSNGSSINAAASSRGTILVCTGRSEFIEKYYEVVDELRGRTSGHVASFEEFEQDMEAVRRQILEPFCPRPWFALAHSMAGPIVLNYAARSPDVFERLVLSAPMIDIARLPQPALSRLLARYACRLGLARREIPTGRNRALFVSTFEGNILTSDRRRFERTAGFLKAEPRLALGPPTFGWMHAAFTCLAALDGERFGRDFVTPTLIVMPGSDTVVDGRAAERLAARLRAGTLVTVPGSLHEVLMERDSLRQQFWAAFDAFIPGSPSEDANFVARAVAASGAEASRQPV